MKSKTRRDIQDRFRLWSIAHLNGSFTTRQATDWFLFHRELYFNTGQPSWMYQTVMATGVPTHRHFFLPISSMLEFLKQLEKDGLVTKQLVDRQTLKLTKKNGTYLWTWVE